MLKRFVMRSFPLRLGVRGLGDNNDCDKQQRFSVDRRTEDRQQRFEWQQRSEAAASFCYVTGASAGLVLLTEGMPGYGIVVGCVGCAFAQLCTVEYATNRAGVISRAASMLVVGVAGFWIIRSVIKNVNGMNERWEEQAKRVAAAEKD
jgi:hypothetical protein